MDIQQQTMLTDINKFCQGLEQEFDLILANRKEQLLLLKDYIVQKIEKQQIPKIIVICTHNSRRSHIGQLCLSLARDYYQLPALEAFSGGTEATAFNIRAVQAFQSIGFDISTQHENAENPIYDIKWRADMQPYLAFSKRYAAPPNPTEQFAAIMVCSQADEGCPIVLGCDFRLSLPYKDPKDFDDTEVEQKMYDEKIREIGREMFFVLSQIEE